MQTSVNRGYGLDRGAVARAQAFAHSQATSRRSRSALARCASCAERNSLGFTHRRSLARSSGPLSALSNLPSPLSTVAARWHADPAVARPRRRSTGARQTRSVGDLHRRQLQFGEKRGAAELKLASMKIYIDASFSSAKKGALLSARLAAE